MNAIQLNSTQLKIVELHNEFKELLKITHRLTDEEELSKEIFRLRRQLIAELYPKG